MIGQTLNNRYTITARLGKGAMGTVYRATDPQSGRDVAVKVISSDLAVDPAMLERFKREGEALRQLKHINIVGFIDAFQHDEQAVIVMEHVEGGSLYDLIKKGPLPIEHAVQIALDLCDALISSHRLKIIHRDIKPENILIDNDGTPKLADFGVARLSEGTRMTRSGVQVGTPYYMAPEAWEGRTLDAQADIWSLGVVLFEMLAGQVPFGGDTPLAVMSRINTTPPPDLRKLRADVPPGLVRIIGRMLTRNKQRRYQTMREVAVELEREQQAMAPRAKKPRVDTYQQIAARIATLRKNSNAILSTSKSKLTKLTSGLRTAVGKVPPNSRIVGIVGLIILVIAVVFFPSLQSWLDASLSSPGPVSPPAAAPMDGSVVFSITESDVFYLYGAANPIIPVGDGINWDPVLSSGGNIYFTSNRDGKAEIYRRFPDGKIERFTNTPDPFESWGAAPSLGGNLYFTSNREDGKAEIYRARLIDGQWKYERFTHTPEEFESWGAAPSIGGNLYFTSNREDNKAEIYRRLIDGNIERVTHTPEEFESWGAAPSPGGNLYFTSDREDNKAEIYRRLINGGIERVTHTDGEFGSWGPIFYGLNIYFTSNRSTKNEVYLLDPLTNILNIESWTNLSDESSDEASPLFPNHLE
jgi:serine/threonine protein kinase